MRRGRPRVPRRRLRPKRLPSSRPRPPSTRSRSRTRRTAAPRSTRSVSWPRSRRDGARRTPRARRSGASARRSDASATPSARRTRGSYRRSREGQPPHAHSRESTADAGSDRPEPAASRAEPAAAAHVSSFEKTRRSSSGGAPPPPPRSKPPPPPPRAHPLVRGRRLARGPRGARGGDPRGLGAARGRVPDRRRDRVVGRRGEMPRPPPARRGRGRDASRGRRRRVAEPLFERIRTAFEQPRRIVGRNASGRDLRVGLLPRPRRRRPRGARGGVGRRDVQTVRLARRRETARIEVGAEVNGVAWHRSNPLATRRRLRRRASRSCGTSKNNNGATRRVHEPDEPDDEPFLSRGARPYSPGKRPPSFGVFIPRGGPRGRGVLHRRDVARAVPRE